MHREHREVKKMEYMLDQWLRNQKLATAQNVPLFGKDRAAVVVPLEKVYDEYMRQHPGADEEFVRARLEKAKGSYPGIRFFEDSPMVKRES